jgi:hypothetical protein
MRKQIEINAIVCTMVLFLCSCDEKSHPCENNDLCIDKASCVPDAKTGRNWCKRWESPLSASKTSDWKDAVIGNKYEVDFEASGGFPPYNWVLNEGKDLPSNLSWLTLASEGANKEKARLIIKSGSTPGPGDVTSGIPIKITVFDSSIRGTENRMDNNGIIFDEVLNIKGCWDKTMSCCYNRNEFCGKENWGNANCNNGGTIQKCWTDPLDPDGCTVWMDQGMDCRKFNAQTCTVAGDGVVTCNCNTGWVGDNCGYLSLISIPGGTFQRDATLDNISEVFAFHISEMEVTRAQFAVVTGLSDPSDPNSSTGINDPVQNVSWYHALVFCNKLSIAENLTPVYAIKVSDNDVANTNPDDWIKANGGTVPSGLRSNATWDAVTANWSANGYRLPTEMEWMWAAMGATRGSGDHTNDIFTDGFMKEFAGDLDPKTLIGHH